jgi:NAD(P)-dependent dehydrogenase (short-subunit alcohol dehydrogenase family)
MYVLIFPSAGGRDIMAKTEVAVRDVLKQVEVVGTVEVVCLNLASLATVRQDAQELLQKLEKIHLLVNNAGTLCLQDQNLYKLRPVAFRGS